MRILYAIIGALIGAATDVLINLLAAAVQQRAWGEQQFNNQAIGWLMGLAFGGLLLGLYLGKVLELPVVTPTPAPTSRILKRNSANRVKITRLRALLSYNKLRGQGIELSDILSVGSVVIIDTRD